jgi:hypothetical protein
MKNIGKDSVITEKRKLYKFEIEIILSLTEIWSERKLISIDIKIEISEDFYVITRQSAAKIDQIYLNSQSRVDIDGGILDVILFKDSQNELLELDIIRLDTKPLLFPSLLAEPEKLDRLFHDNFT